MKCVRYAVLLTVIVSGYSALLSAAGFSADLSPTVRRLPSTPAISTGLNPPVQKKQDKKLPPDGSRTPAPIQLRLPAGGIARPASPPALKGFKAPTALPPVIQLPGTPAAHGFKPAPATPSIKTMNPAMGRPQPAPVKGGFGLAPVPGTVSPAAGKPVGKKPAGPTNRSANPATLGGFAAPAATTRIDRTAIIQNTREFQRLKEVLEAARRAARERQERQQAELARRRSTGVGGDDCDDTRADVYPGATEICDHRDNNCDGRVDEGQTILVYQDADGDLHGAPGTGEDVCPADFRDAQTHGHWLSTVGNDCDDTDKHRWDDCH